MSIPDARARILNGADTRSDADFVLYWMTANRRLSWNFALDHALDQARSLGLPLVVLEGLRAGYRWAADRHHGFILDGMREHRAELEDGPILYYPYVEAEPDDGKGLLKALSEHAALIVADDYPAFFLPRMLQAAADQVECRMVAVDSNGLLPLSVPGRTFTAAYHFRRWLQKNLGDHLTQVPDGDPLADVGDLEAIEALPDSIVEEWPPATDEVLTEDADLSVFPIDHSVARTDVRGGTGPARTRLKAFIEDGLGRYSEERNDPDAGAESGLSPWLHYGHVSVHEVFHAVAQAEGWSPGRVADEADGKRYGWWGMSEPAEEFLDQITTWRDLGFVYCHEVPDYAEYETLPEWARKTLETHASDPREYVYSLEEFAGAETHDGLWNAAQRQLVGEGVIHNYLRMLWGKKILEWTESPQAALDIMIELNNRYALDGRDPNSYSGIFWTLGRFDRGWPERDVFGKVRSMTSKSTRRKVKLDAYLKRWGD